AERSLPVRSFVCRSGPHQRLHSFPTRRSSDLGGTLGYPTANLRVDPDLLVPAYGIYAGAAAGHRAAVSIGTNPHYGGRERRVERSEEHTSELQSRGHLVCRLLLEKKKQKPPNP